MFSIRFRKLASDFRHGDAVVPVGPSWSRSSKSHSLAPIASGDIVLGAFKESFESPLLYWQEMEYERHWATALSQLLSGDSKTALVTAMYDPKTATFLRWWTMYREGQSVFVQNQLLFLDQLSRPFEVTAIGEFVKPRNTVSEDGVKISEWNVSLDEIGAFCRDEKKK